MNRITDQQVGARIVQLREARDWNQGDLAEALRAYGLNWSQGTLSKVETGSRPVRLVEVPLLLDVLQAKVDDLIDLDRDPSLLAQTTRASLQNRLVELRGAASNVDAIEALAGAVKRAVVQSQGSIQTALIDDALAQGESYDMDEVVRTEEGE